MKSAAAAQDTAASEPQARPANPSGQGAREARCRRRLGRWLGWLAGIGTTLAARISLIAKHRAHSPDPAPGSAPHPVRVDLTLAWALVARAMRWTRALQARLAPETAAVKAESDPEEMVCGLLRGLEVRLDGLCKDRDARRAAPAETPEPDVCIDGRPAAEVVGQICADFDAAATLLGDIEATRQIATIATAACALLGGPPKTWRAEPIHQMQSCAAGEPEPEMINGVAVPVPDTG